MKWKQLLFVSLIGGLAQHLIACYESLGETIRIVSFCLTVSLSIIQFTAIQLISSIIGIVIVSSLKILRMGYEGASFIPILHVMAGLIIGSFCGLGLIINGYLKNEQSILKRALQVLCSGVIASLLIWAFYWFFFILHSYIYRLIWG